MPITIETDGSNESGPCECCGHMGRTVWGYLHDNSSPVAAYFVQWTLGRVEDHGANFDLIIGEWGGHSSPKDRAVVAVAFRRVSGAPQFMIIDAESRPAARSKHLATVAMQRVDVVGTPLAPRVFAMLDAIWTGDSRIAEVVEHVSVPGSASESDPRKD